MTATATRPKDVLAQLDRLERAWAEAAEARGALSRTHKAGQDALRVLIERQRSLLHREPGQFNHDGSPLTDDNGAAEILREIEALGQTDFRSEMAHLDRIEAAAKNAAHGYMAGHLAEIVEALRPEAEAAAAAVSAALEPVREAVEAYLAMHRRAVGLTAPVQSVDGRSVPGLDVAAELRRVLQGWDLPAPLPELNR